MLNACLIKNWVQNLSHLKSVQCQINCNPYAWYYIQWSHNSQFVVKFMNSVWHWKWAVWHLHLFYNFTCISYWILWKPEKFTLNLPPHNMTDDSRYNQTVNLNHNFAQLEPTASTKRSSRFMIGSGYSTGDHSKRDCADDSWHRQEIPDSHSSGWYRRLRIDVTLMWPHASYYSYRAVP